MAQKSSNTESTTITFRVAYHSGPGLDIIEVQGTDYEVSGGELHIAGAGEVGVFAAGNWAYAHGVVSAQDTE